MRIGDTLFFSPNYPFRHLDFTNPDQIALAFQDRVDRSFSISTRFRQSGGNAFGYSRFMSLLTTVEIGNLSGVRWPRKIIGRKRILLGMASGRDRWSGAAEEDACVGLG
jgi:hypothetical protein